MRVGLSRIVLSALALAGCGGHTLDVGSRDGGSTPESTQANFGDASAASGVWNGTLENRQLMDGSNALTMTLQVAADGTTTGTLLLGDGSVLQPATDPNVGYPPGARFSDSGLLQVVEGFSYTLVDGVLKNGHLTFRVAEIEVWTQWCAIQTAYAMQPAGSGVYSCLPPGGASSKGNACFVVDPTTMQNLPIDCGKVDLCSLTPPMSRCQCSATGCQINPSLNADVSFDLTVAGAKADGTTSGGLGKGNVSFVRAQ